MSTYNPSKYDSFRGKATRIRLLKEILADAGGRMKYTTLKRQLKLRGFPHLHEKLEAMGFTVDDEGYVVKNSSR